VGIKTTTNNSTMFKDNRYDDINVFDDKLCEFYLNIEDYEHARKVAAEILKKEPSNQRALWAKGYINEMVEKLPEALSYYEELDRYDPRDPYVLKRKAVVEMKLGMGKKALADINNAIDTEADDTDAYLIRGMLYFYLFDRKIDAIRDYNRAVHLDPKNAEALYQRGFAYLKYGNMDYAKDDLKRAAELGSVDAEDLVEKNRLILSTA